MPSPRARTLLLLGAACAALVLVGDAATGALVDDTPQNDAQRSLATRLWSSTNRRWLRRREKLMDSWVRAQALQPEMMRTQSVDTEGMGLQDSLKSRARDLLRQQRRLTRKPKGKAKRPGSKPKCVDDDAAVEAKCKTHEKTCDGVSTCADVVTFHQCEGFFLECCEACTQSAVGKEPPEPVPVLVPSPAPDLIPPRASPAPGKTASVGAANKPAVHWVI